MKAILVVSLMIMAVVANAKSKKVDWTLCEQEIKNHCASSKSDHDKHECIEKLAKDKVSDECRVKNEKLEGTFGKHKHDHK